jgi:hypothetical protein
VGRGKNGKGRNEAAMRIHDEWANRFRRLTRANVLGYPALMA